MTACISVRITHPWIVKILFYSLLFKYQSIISTGICEGKKKYVFEGKLLAAFSMNFQDKHPKELSPTGEY